MDSLKGVVKELLNEEKHRLDRKIKGIIKRNEGKDNREERNLQKVVDPRCKSLEAFVRDSSFALQG